MEKKKAKEIATAAAKKTKTQIKKASLPEPPKNKPDTTEPTRKSTRLQKITNRDSFTVELNMVEIAPNSTHKKQP